MDETEGHWAEKPFLRLDEKGNVIERLDDTPSKCGFCKWFEVCPPEQQGQSVVGYCRRNPPQTTDQMVGGEYIGAWPLVNSKDWCGEFEVKAKS